jgi:hemerythrin-like domain-containing protein
MEKRQANVGLSLLALHRCITRGIDVSTSNSRLFAAQGFPDTRTREGFINYIRSLGIVLLAHHLVEDEVGFPRLKTQIPEAPYNNLTAQHMQIQSMISEIEQIADRLEGDSFDSHM